MKRRFKRTNIQALIMSSINDDVFNKWCLITYATYKNNYKGKPTSRSYCYTLAKNWESDGDYTLWLYFEDNCRKLNISWSELNEYGDEEEISSYETSLYLTNEEYTKLGKYISSILDTKEYQEMKWGEKI